MAAREPKTVHLVCNAHLDPVWQWEWEEGAAEAVSTFRTACEFCEGYDAFVFNHNEAVLYEWVEEYDPELFRRIQELVKRGKWHIAGGWFLQPDCNMPSGESFVRQILYGRRYFKDRFGVENTTAYNFDPFGHPRGLVQILAKAGYDSYIHCRPSLTELLQRPPASAYRWVGYDGSSVAALHAHQFYLSARGKAAEKVAEVIEDAKEDPLPALLVLWGVGNHGGGASRADLDALEELRKKRTDVRIIHSTPEAFFKEIRSQEENLPSHEHPLQRCFPGCYTTMARVKQGHRQLESILYASERMASQAYFQGLLPEYPTEELNAALHDLLFCEFHDILPGSSVRAVEEQALRILGGGIETCAAVRARAFFALCRGERKAKEGEFPVFAMNPHPWPVQGSFSCEIQLPDLHLGEVFFAPTVRQEGKVVPSQCEHEAGNISAEWRKKIVFKATLSPARINRFDVVFTEQRKRPQIRLRAREGLIRFRGSGFSAVINARTGLMDSFKVGGKELLRKNSFRILCLHDDDDSWGTLQHRLRRLEGAFKKVSDGRANELRGFPGATVGAVTVIEDGAVRSVVESVFSYHDSHAMLRYILPKEGTGFDVEVMVNNAEKSKMLKLSLALSRPAADVFYEVPYGREQCVLDGSEHVAQQWVMALSASKGHPALGVLNRGTHGFDATSRELRLDLLRSPLYTHMPTESRGPTKDRYHDRIDQGERRFSLRIVAGAADSLLERIEREAFAFNQAPFLLSYYPSGGQSGSVRPLAVLSDPAIVLSAAKKAEDGGELVLRLFEPTGQARKTTLRVLGRWQRQLHFGPFEVKTLRVNPKSGATREVDLLER